MDFPGSIEELHHAYIFEGSSVSEVLEIIKGLGFSTSDNPDITIRNVQSFGINDARAIRGKAILKPISNSRQVFIIETVHITHEAQNALLKVLEEPTGFSIFFIITPKADTLLPTLISRTCIIRSDKAIVGDSNSTAFLKAPIHERLNMIIEMLPKGEKKEKDLGAIVRFLNGLELQLAVLSKTDPINATKGLKALYIAKKYCMDKGASHKILLEQTALLVPRVQP